MIIKDEIQRDVATIEDDRTVIEAAKLMSERFIGSLVVFGKDGVEGLISERELMIKVLAEGLDPATTLVRDAMASSAVRVAPTDTNEHCLDLMKKNRCRHLLVFEDDLFVGIVSLRDMVALMLREREELIVQLKQFISG